MKFSNIRTTIIRGLTLAVPLAVIAYVFIRMIDIIRKVITPLSLKLGINRLLGNATLTILTLLLILIIVFILGLLTRFASVSTIRQQLENIIIRFVPSLHYLKLMAADKLTIANSQPAWKPVLVFSEEKYSAGFIVEESELLVTIFVSKGTSLKDGEILTANKADVLLFPATYEQLDRFSREFGKGFISIINQAVKQQKTSA